MRTVEIGSFSAAAREFGTTQPTVSKQIAALEDQTLLLDDRTEARPGVHAERDTLGVRRHRLAASSGPETDRRLVAGAGEVDDPAGQIETSEESRDEQSPPEVLE